jgi:hypothetical protein
MQRCPPAEAHGHYETASSSDRSTHAQHGVGAHHIVVRDRDAVLEEILEFRTALQETQRDGVNDFDVKV